MPSLRDPRRLLTLPIALALAAGVLPLAPGCGDGKGAGTNAAVAPEYADKNKDMLLQMQKDMATKYKKAPGKR